MKYNRIFEIFEQLCQIPHGSGNMKAIADYCVRFAQNNSLDYVRDNADNVIVYKVASAGYENAKPIILQGHLDMVCQKTADSDFDFTKDALELYQDGDFIKAKNTTLGADNGIAVAYILSILESKTLMHPPIEAVFTVDEEIGMVGALQLDMSQLKGKRMINLDSEEESILTVSCAGGSDFLAVLSIERVVATGTRVKITVKGLQGGHSGVEINKGRLNANILSGRILNHLKNEFELISISGGDKGNAIPNYCEILLCTADATVLKGKAEEYFNLLVSENSAREPHLCFEFEILESGKYEVIKAEQKAQIIKILATTPNGVCQMSCEIEGLVESSLNLGILNTSPSEIEFLFSLRSNKISQLEYLAERQKALFCGLDCRIEQGGFYPPWEFNENSKLQGIYKECYKNLFGSEPNVEAIHAGLECGVFASQIKGFDCIAMGPSLFDVHTVNERLSVSSAKRVYELLLEILQKCND